MYWTSTPRKTGWYVGRYEDGYMCIVHFHYAKRDGENGIKAGDFVYGFSKTDDNAPATEENLRIMRYARITEPLNA